MISFELLHDKGVLVVRAQSTLEAGDFHRLSHAVDLYNAEKGTLSGLLIDALVSRMGKLCLAN